jgi:hypothetical protein
VAEKLVGQKFGPAGFTGDKEFPSVHSFSDLLGQWLRKKWGARSE